MASQNAVADGQTQNACFQFSVLTKFIVEAERKKTQLTWKIYKENERNKQL